MPVGGPELDTVMLNACMAVCPVESFAWTVKLDVPAVVGVPLMVLPFSDKPAGREPEVMDQIYGAVPPVAASVPE